MYDVLLIPGDGIGPSIADAAKRVLEATGVRISWKELQAGVRAMKTGDSPLPAGVIRALRDTGIALKGPLATPVGSGFRSVNVALRKEFDLYANVRPVRSFPGVRSRYDGVDLVIVRENTEGLYTGLEHYTDETSAVAEMVGRVSRAGSERVIRYAYDYAASHGRRKVTIVHKANILKLTSGMFLEIGKAVGKEYPSIETEEKIIDNMAMQLVLDPHQFDVIVTTNLFGDILSDLASGLVGGLGLAPGANIGTDAAVFEAVHGSAPDIAGRNIANPCALVLAGAMMLRHLGEQDAADRVEAAVRQVISDGKAVTKDLTSEKSVGTTEMAEEIARVVREGTGTRPVPNK